MELNTSIFAFLPSDFLQYSKKFLLDYPNFPNIKALSYTTFQFFRQWMFRKFVTQKKHCS